MNFEDPVVGQGYELAEIFAHASSEFELTPWKLGWESPCWVDADIITRPQSLRHPTLEQVTELAKSRDAESDLERMLKSQAVSVSRSESR